MRTAFIMISIMHVHERYSLLDRKHRHDRGIWKLQMYEAYMD